MGNEQSQQGGREEGLGNKALSSIPQSIRRRLVSAENQLRESAGDNVSVGVSSEASDSFSVVGYVPNPANLEQLKALTETNFDGSQDDDEEDNEPPDPTPTFDGVHVVTSLQPRTHSDTASDMLLTLPKVLPIIPASIDNRVFNYADLPHLRPDSPFDRQAALHLCRRYQKKLRESALLTVGKQRQLQSGVQETEKKALASMELLGRHERHMLRVAADLREVQTIGRALSQARNQAYRLMEAMQKVNLALPPDLRMKDFEWHVLPGMAEASINISEQRRLTEQRQQQYLAQQQSGQSTRLAATLLQRIAAVRGPANAANETKQAPESKEKELKPMSRGNSMGGEGRVNGDEGTVRSDWQDEEERALVDGPVLGGSDFFKRHVDESYW